MGDNDKKKCIDLKRISSHPIKRGFATKPLVFVEQIFFFFVCSSIPRVDPCVIKAYGMYVANFNPQIFDLRLAPKTLKL
jgi:hypothetical protein